MTRIDSLDIPQQDDLQKVRSVVAAVHDGTAVRELPATTGISRRHVRYTLHAARTLGWLALEPEDVWTMAPPGVALLEHAAGSPAERAAMQQAVSASPALEALAPDLFTRTPPPLEELATRLMDRSSLSASTAQRRAMTILAWREQTVAPEPPVAPKAEPPRAKGGDQMSLF